MNNTKNQMKKPMSLETVIEERTRLMEDYNLTPTDTGWTLNELHDHTLRIKTAAGTVEEARAEWLQAFLGCNALFEDSLTLADLALIGVEAIYALDYHNQGTKFVVGQNVQHVDDNGEIHAARITGIVGNDALELEFFDGDEGTENCSTCFHSQLEVTTRHPKSEFGVPVILNDAGEVVNHSEGVKLVRARLGLSTQALADLCGVSRRTVEGWESSGKTPSAAALNVMARLLRKK